MTLHYLTKGYAHFARMFQLTDFLGSHDPLNYYKVWYRTIRVWAISQHPPVGIEWLFGKHIHEETFIILVFHKVWPFYYLYNNKVHSFTDYLSNYQFEFNGAALEALLRREIDILSGVCCLDVWQTYSSFNFFIHVV
jgi:hypothetical protein